MFHETIRSPGLAHLSYLIGDGDEAAVIDPRIDFDVYLERAREHGARIALIYETHRNEDIVSGARALSEATGARVLHGAALDFGYGEGVEHGAEERLGELRLRALHTPGHTDESLSIAYYDESSGDSAVGVFTGDALFVGDVGRTDFYPDRPKEVAAALFESLHERLLPLGDQALIHPAHGAGSVCGQGMADRELSSIGYERRHNPRLSLAREDFVRAKLAEEHPQPPYFREMEAQNQRGAAPLPRALDPRPVGPEALERALGQGLLLVDVRSAEAFAGCSVPGSVALPLALLGGYAGWLLPYDRPLGLVAEDADAARAAALRLARMGYRDIEGWLAGGVQAWVSSGRAPQAIPLLSAHELKERVEARERFTLLDVRTREEYEAGHLPGAVHAFLGSLQERAGLDELPAPRVTFCGSGQRALVAASLLRRRGVGEVENCFGSMQACAAIGCPLESGDGDGR